MLRAKVAKALCLAGLFLALVAAVGRVSVACETFPQNGEWLFSVLRDDIVVGTHRFRFDRQADRFVVRVDAEAAWIARSGLDYRLSHHSEEVWVDGWLDSVVSDTRD